MVRYKGRNVLTIKHLTRDPKEPERFFEYRRLLKKGKHYSLYLPRRQFFVQLVKFAPGKGPDDYVKYYMEVDERLRARYGKTRHEMGIHEIVTFVTLGAHDMIVIWDAPDVATYSQFLASYVEGGNPGGFGSNQTETVSSSVEHT